MRRVLFVNSVQKQCGVYSYGLRSYNILKQSELYNFIYCEPSDNIDYMLLIQAHNPDGVIFNFHPSTMAWLTERRFVNEKRYILWHEGVEHWNLNPDYWLYVDSTLSDKDKSFSIPRPIIGTKIRGLVGVVNLLIKSSIRKPIITTFGFGFGCKGFGRVVQMVNDQFDEATIRIHIPRAYYGDRDGEATAGVVPGCQNEMRKQGIDLLFSHEFLSDSELLSFLSQSDLNIFLYDEMHGRGLSSVIDYALSVDVPIAINDSWMFRHIQNPHINVANKSLKEIIDQGPWPVNKFKHLYSNENFLSKYEKILNDTL